jgi:hypothetical protein
MSETTSWPPRVCTGLGDRIQETYSHVAAEVEQRLLEALNDRWDKAVADSPDRPTGVANLSKGSRRLRPS